VVHLELHQLDALATARDAPPGVPTEQVRISVNFCKFLLTATSGSACIPDATSTLLSSEQEKSSKEKVKGELIRFIIRTARDFATRQVQTKSDPKR